MNVTNIKWEWERKTPRSGARQAHRAPVVALASNRSIGFAGLNLHLVVS
jgi:hypothetical protein